MFTCIAWQIQYIHTYINKTEVVSKSLTIKHVKEKAKLDRLREDDTICDMLQDDLSSTFRNRAYFFFMFYLHDISIQSLKLVSYITVERKILQIDEGGASKLKSGKLRNIMIVSLLNIHVNLYLSINSKSS
jgi:hypothetical protein